MISQTVPLFFAFPDGVLHHVCAECTAICCRGHGFAGSLKREMPFLFRQYPALGSMVVEREKDLVTCATPAGQCFFLRPDNLCQIEVEHGRAKKPGICLLFPFNDFYRIGNTLVIAPHFMCPLRLSLPSAPDKVEGAHAKIEETIRQTAIVDPEYVRRFIDDASLPIGDTPSAALDREVEFRDRCSKGLGVARFWDILQESSTDSGSLKSFRSRIARFMRWPAPPESRERDYLDDLLLALASSLRLEALAHSAEGLLRFLTAAELLTRRVFSIALAPAALQAVYGVVNEMRPALHLLAWDHKAPALKRPHLKSPTFGDPNLVSIAQTALNNMPIRGVLPALEKACPSRLSTADRTALVQQLANVVGPASRKRQ